MKTEKFFKYSLVYAILNFVLLCLVGYICLDKYIPMYFISLYIFLIIICLHKLYETLKRICYCPTCNLLQASEIASLGRIKTINSNSSINRCLKIAIWAKNQIQCFSIMKEKYKYLLISSNEMIYSRTKNE